ncbi:MAG TPA: hypothetical protein VG944_06290 [Fimbriimonas sp.]|nr:hypothetical protein [Fimbriimonas sp.]
MPNPFSEEAPYWAAALEAYQQDQLIEAWDRIEPHGIGEAGMHIRWYRLIEAEKLLRDHSVFTEVSDWLTLETVPSETLEAEKWLGEQAIEVANKLETRFNWKGRPKVLLSILCRDSETPWATNPHGYWVSKDPHDKICLPFYLLEDSQELRRALAHELSHVVCADLSAEHAPTWLHEAMSMIAEDAMEEFEEEPAAMPKSWLKADALEMLLEHENPDDVDEVFEGYLQCAWIGRYLASKGSDGHLSRLLIEHADEALQTNLGRLLRGEDRTGYALRRVYGMSVKRLFMEAEAWANG